VSAVPRPLGGVLFDLDGVIVDTASLHFAAWQRLADSLSLQFDERLNRALKGVDRLGSLERLLGSQAHRYTADEKLRMADLKNSWYVESLESIAAGDLLPGADEALDQVRRSGLKLALVSASRNAMTVLVRLGIVERFDAIVDSSSISNGKPAPDIFLAAARQVGVAPGQCLGIEDAAAGVAGLKAAGMAAIGVGDPVELHEADWVLPDLTRFHLSDYRGAR
jgi:beta-phosphoglucomutase